MESKLFTLYGLKRPDDNIIRYIGITCVKLSRRRGNHVAAKGANPHKDSWIAKMLPLTPEIVPYAVELSFEEAGELEKLVIAGLRKSGAGLVNISGGGEAPMLGMKHSAEAKEKIGRAIRGRKHAAATIEKMSGENNSMFGTSRSGEKNPMFGKRHSQGAIEKMSAARTGKVPWNKGLKKI